MVMRTNGDVSLVCSGRARFIDLELIEIGRRRVFVKRQQKVDLPLGGGFACVQ